VLTVRSPQLPIAYFLATFVTLCRLSGRKLSHVHTAHDSFSQKKPENTPLPKNNLALQTTCHSPDNPQNFQGLDFGPQIYQKINK